MAFFCWFSILILGVLSRSQIVCSQLPQEEATLVALRKELGITFWDQNTTNYCHWPRIKCFLNNSMVMQVNLSRLGLQGNLTLVSQLKNLRWLDLSMNNFRGPIPPNFGDLLELEFIDLSWNKFEGSIPKELGKLSNLKLLNFSSNRLSGEIPDELEGLKSLRDFQIFTNIGINGSIPSWVGNLPNLRVFTAYENKLSGNIPKNLGLNSEIQLLNLHSNQLEGPIPESIFASGKLEFLVLTQNQLGGELHESIGKCKGLSSIRIGNNQIMGSIPKSIGNISSLTYFEADNNNFSGEIVSEFAQCSNLTLLNLAQNGFTGTIPSQLGQLPNLQELIVSGNSLFGEIPTSILSSNNLSKLDLNNNRLNGTIPIGICNTTKLQYLLLSQNSIRGDLPRQIGKCVKLLELQLGTNYLTGTIPPEIGRIRNLQIALNLSFNHLHGPLPNDLGRLDKLVSLDVSNNRLSGNIPSALKGMLSLIEVNFTNNEFTGPIPVFVPFQKSPNSSFLGNKGLCGVPLSSSCGNSYDHTSYHHRASFKIVLAVIGSGLTVFLSVTIVVVLFTVRERREKAAKSAEVVNDETKDKPLIIATNVYDENLRQEIDFDAVVKATSKDSNNLSSGSFSTVYKAIMPSGMILSVKKLKSVDRTIVHHQSKMIRELERLSKLSHENLAKLIGYVIHDDVALLLHHYFPNRALAQLLHEKSKLEDYKPDWPARLRIAIDVAQGLAFLHHVAIIHLDISSSNVLLDSDCKALLSEVEISKLLDPSRGTASISAVAGSFGYMPPEYAYTMQVTAPGNVYSYGVILLEILTTRLPVDEAFGEGIDLVKWIHNAPIRGETPEQILDSRLSTISFAWRKQMLAALKVALQCTDSIPAKRPKMKKVVEMLQEIMEG